MAKRKNLNGLPRNLVDSYFGTLRYYKCGYMADWLVYAAKRIQKQEATLDILTATIDPPELNLYPLQIHLKDLNTIIQKELKQNQFPPDFIIEAKIKVQFFIDTRSPKLFYCFPTLIDKEGHKYEPGKILESAYEKDFDPFDKINLDPYNKLKDNLLLKLRNFFRKTRSSA